MSTRLIILLLRSVFVTISTVAITIIAIILLATNISSCNANGNTMETEEIGQKVLTFANNQGAEAELIGVNDNGQLYEVVLSIQGQEVPVYVTRDGENLIPSLIPLTENAAQSRPQQTAPTQTEFSEEDNTKIQEFSSCLAEKGLRIYGAGWCGYCQKLIETFGGAQNMEGVLIECSDANQQPTEHAQLCSDQEIKGFPTIKLNDETVQISRTLEAMAEATGCTAPQLG